MTTRRNGSREKSVSGPFLKYGCSFFHPIAYFEKGPMKPGVMAFILQNL